jgi:hypothetical protein
MQGAGSPAKLEDLTPGVRASGVVVGQVVTVVDVRWHGSNAVTVTYRTDMGQVDQRLLYRDNEPSLSVQQRSRAYAFDGDPAMFRLAAEALRIRMAARFDPMLAVTSSDTSTDRFAWPRSLNSVGVVSAPCRIQVADPWAASTSSVWSRPSGPTSAMAGFKMSRTRSRAPSASSAQSAKRHSGAAASRTRHGRIY